jgi:hypothetical protein
MRRRYALITFLYMFGMGSFLLVDLLIARVASTEVIANWAATKSAVMIGSTLILFGLDQVMVRIPYQASFILRLSFLQIPILASIYVFLLSLSGVVNGNLWEILAVSAVAVSLAQFGFYRAKNQLLTSQLATNSWRFIFLAVVVVAASLGFLGNFSLLVVVSVALATLLNWVIRQFYKEPQVVPPGQEETLKGIYALGANFFVSLATLNIAVFMEQLMLNMTGHTEASATYFSHTAIILPLLIPFNGLIGFLLGPYIRKDIGRFDRQLTKYWWTLPVVATVMALVGFALSLLLYFLFYSDRFVYDYRLASLIILVGFLRIIYIFPSSYLGVTAEKQLLGRFVTVAVFSTVISIVLYFILVYAGMNPIYAVAFSSLLNWGARTLSGVYLMKRIWDARSRLSLRMASQV